MQLLAGEPAKQLSSDPRRQRQSGLRCKPGRVEIKDRTRLERRTRSGERASCGSARPVAVGKAVCPDGKLRMALSSSSLVLPKIKVSPARTASNAPGRPSFPPRFDSRRH